MRIGWIGSVSTLKYLRVLQEPISILLSKGIDVKLVVAGTKNRSELLPDFGKKIITEIPNYTAAEIPLIVSSFDIGVMPLTSGIWEEAKCAMKALVYMAGWKPTICSPVGENKMVIEHMKNGLLADTTAEWVKCFEDLYYCKELQKKIGIAGRKTVEERYTVDVCYQILFSELKAMI